MKRVLIDYTYTMKDGITGHGKMITTIENEVPEQEAKLEARRDFFEDHGFYKCFEVLELEVVNIAGVE
jgi:hypothetical protein